MNEPRSYLAHLLRILGGIIGFAAVVTVILVVLFGSLEMRIMLMLLIMAAVMLFAVVAGLLLVVGLFGALVVLPVLDFVWERQDRISQRELATNGHTPRLRRRRSR